MRPSDEKGICYFRYEDGLDFLNDAECKTKIFQEAQRGPRAGLRYGIDYNSQDLLSRDDEWFEAKRAEVANRSAGSPATGAKEDKPAVTPRNIPNKANTPAKQPPQDEEQRQ